MGSLISAFFNQVPHHRWPILAKEQEDKTVTLMQNITPEEVVNILVVGLPGAGKSTLVSSLRSCITHDHDIELSAAGKNDGGGSYTTHLRKYNNAFKNCSRIQNSPVVMYDMPGLLNQADNRFDAILRCILKGAVPPNELILEAECQTKEQIEQRFTIPDSNRRIDRVIFVHSCNEVIPENLIHTVVKVCKEFDVTLFAVLTHIDQIRYISSPMYYLEAAVGTKGSPRGFAIELYHKGTMRQGQYKDKPETNFHLYKLWQVLLNTDYPKLSTTAAMAVPKVLSIDTPDHTCDGDAKHGVSPVDEKGSAALLTSSHGSPDSDKSLMNVNSS